METAGTMLQNHGDGVPGVAATRVALVVAIVGFQSIQVSENYVRIASTPAWIFAVILYPALFAISGFLLARSADHRQIGDFLQRRVRRMLPALVLIVLLSALVLGPLATTKPFRAYATDPDFGLYFLNILAWPRFSLPAVFQFNNAGTVVNLPLWLSPFVVAMVAIAALARRFGTGILFAALVLLIVAVAVAALLVPDPAGFANLQRKLLDGSGAAVVLAFLLGALAYRLRHRLPMRAGIAYLCLAALIGAALLGNTAWVGIPAANLLLAVPVAYVALFVIFQDLPLPGQALRMERYLVGLLLFSFPVQQLWIAFGPRQQSFLLNFLLALPSTMILVLLAWHGLQRRLFQPAVDDPRFGEAARQPLVILSRRQLVAGLPTVVSYLALGLALFVLVLGIMALTLLAFQRESGGV